MKTLCLGVALAIEIFIVFEKERQLRAWKQTAERSLQIAKKATETTKGWQDLYNKCVHNSLRGFGKGDVTYYFGKDVEHQHGMRGHYVNGDGGTYWEYYK